MYVLIRKHIIPDYGVTLIKKTYLDKLNETGVLISKWDMDFWIKKNISFRDSVVQEYSIVIEFDREKPFLDSVKHNTIVEEWLKDKKKNNIPFCFKKTRLTTTCSICLESNGIFISIEPCNCTFHKHCIITACKYSMLCPLCQTPIKEKNIKLNVKKKKKTS